MSKATNLLILACGEGTRNKAFTFNGAIPKCLQTAGDKTILESVISSYEDIVNYVWIACLNKHAQQIQDVLSFKGVKNFSIVSIDPQPSAFMSLKTVVGKLTEQLSDFNDIDWYVNWSDVFATMPHKTPKSTTIYVDAKYRHRNLAYLDADKNLNVVSTYDLAGNVPGIFFCNGELLRNVALTPTSESDFDKCLSVEPGVNLHKLNVVTDLGDYDKFTTHMQEYVSEHQSRYFNEITVETKTIKKRPVDDYGMKLHKIELNYYKNIGYLIPAFAEFIGYDRQSCTMELERIKGTTCQAKIDACTTAQQKQNKADKLLEAFDEAISQVHAIKSATVPTDAELVAAMHQEFVDAMVKRVTPVKSLIDAVVASGVKSIDGMPITKDFDKLLVAVERWFKDRYRTFSCGITHGDPNTDNCMVQTDGKIRFIDPRGYFGGLNVLGYGVKQYDYAKFVYGMTGYSRFNRAAFIATDIVDGDVKTYIGLSESEGIQDVDMFELDIEDDIRILVGIIWVKLSSYIINDPERSVLAYLYGNALLTKLLDIK